MGGDSYIIDSRFKNVLETFVSDSSGKINNGKNKNFGIRTSILVFFLSKQVILSFLL
jgi:hypothetical protein